MSGTNLLLWLVGFLGLGGVAMAVLVWTVGWPVLMTRGGKIAVALLTGGLGLLVLLAKQRKAIVEEERRKVEEKNHEFAEDARRRMDANSRLPPRDVEQRLRDGTKQWRD